MTAGFGGSNRRLALTGAVVALGGCRATAARGIDVKSAFECLAPTIYFEARAEPGEGKLAVGHVVTNRAQHTRFPRRVCRVVRPGGDKPGYRRQFS